MRRGKVRWYRFKKSDKRRPVAVLTRDSIIDLLEEVTVAPLTPTIRNIPSVVILTQSDGMPKDCAINLDHVQTVSKHRIEALIAPLTSEKMAELHSALLFALGFHE